MSNLPVIFEMGTHVTRLGFAGDMVPRLEIPTIVGHPEEKMRKIGMDIPKIGEDALAVYREYDIKYPIGLGFQYIWEELNIFWTDMFEKKLEVSSEDQPLVVTHTVICPPSNRERLVTNLFDRYNVPALYIACQEKMVLHALGKQTGLVVDSGFGKTTVCPIKDSMVIKNAVARSAVNGYTMLGQFFQWAVDRGYPLDTYMPVTKMTQDMVYVAEDFEQEMAKEEELKHYDLTEQIVVLMGRERFRCGEAFFKPKEMFDMPEQGLHLKIHDSISRCDAAVREELYANIVVAGSNTRYPGFVERLKSELIKSAPDGVTNINVIAPEDRHLLAFRGCSMLAASESFPAQYISRDEYEANSKCMVEEKCVI